MIGRLLLLLRRALRAVNRTFDTPSSQVKYPEDEDADADVILKNEGPWVYELYAVLIHSGSALGGHYYAYLRTGDGKWYEFNDSTISAIDVEDLDKRLNVLENEEDNVEVVKKRL